MNSQWSRVIDTEALRTLSLRRHWPITLGFVVFVIPALLGLIGQARQSEAGSLAPIILALSSWTLWNAYSSRREYWRKGRAAIWVPALIIAAGATIVGSALQFVALLALSAWLAAIATLHAVAGGVMLKKAALPILLLGMVVPLPYALSMRANAYLRDSLSQAAVSTGSALGLDAALDDRWIAIGPYLLAIENACAGANSTLSLVAVGILLAYWIGGGSRTRILVLSLLAIPIALLANLGRVVALMAMTIQVGPSVLETAIHPLSGVLSFAFALTLLLLTARISDLLVRMRRA